MTISNHLSRQGHGDPGHPLQDLDVSTHNTDVNAVCDTLQ